VIFTSCLALPPRSSGMAAGRSSKGCRGTHVPRPGMMTLISVAIATAYGYSSAVVFGLTGKMFFWELASLIDIMLLGTGSR